VSSRDAFWTHVHAALDARRDPLEVAEVQRALSEDPALLGELADLGRGLELLERRRRSHARSLAAAAVLVGLAGLAGAWHAARSGSESSQRSSDSAVVAPLGDPPASAALSSLARSDSVLEPATQRGSAQTTAEAGAGAARNTDSRVLAFRAEVSVEGPGGRTAAASDAEGTRIASASSPLGSRAPFHMQSLIAEASVRSRPR